MSKATVTRCMMLQPFVVTHAPMQSASFALRLAICVSILIAPMPAAHATEEVEQAWLSLIRQALPPSCHAEKLAMDATVSGNNGLRQERWRMDTCRGEASYVVAYYPPVAFPNRKSPFEITRIDTGAVSTVRQAAADSR
ncbi:hypothetical protein GIY21_12970 [Xanthomonas sontii]|uniref:DUF3019 domain-containing protein n=1 Tax=Xanthomonas sontii TaxID=2650745 RepID=A0A6N7QBH1_9XANT|nr:hypothetical protein [Xanthomonas sontii]MRH01200.1 hypothetical protein [Xanthomonas sontii]MRH75363.1 hypothetical protein [Xanthomonas sontii]